MGLSGPWIKAPARYAVEDRRASTGRPDGTAIWLQLAHRVDVFLTWHG
jgi:hypothetical protein